MYKKTYERWNISFKDGRDITKRDYEYERAREFINKVISVPFLRVILQHYFLQFVC